MILIPLNDDWQIRSDTMNLMLEKRYFVEKGKKAGKELWNVEGYYNTFDSLLCGLVRKEIVVSDCKTLEELKVEFIRLQEMITEIHKKFTTYFTKDIKCY